MQITKYPDVDKLLEVILSRIQKVLGQKLVGLYLYGSLVSGDFDDSSDIDLVAALSEDLDKKEFKELEKMHTDLVKEYKEWNDRLEIRYLSITALKTIKSYTGKLAMISPGEPFRILEARKHWLTDWYVAREASVTLFGPSPKTTIEPISKEEFKQAVKENMKDWDKWVKNMRSRYAQSYAILTMCRALYAYMLEEQPSKKKAALWVEKKHPKWSLLIQNALRWRRSEKGNLDEDNENYTKTVEFVYFIRNQILTSNDDLKTVVNEIVNKSVELKNKYTAETSVPIEFACIFCQTDQDYKRFSDEIKKVGKIVEDTPTGFTYLLNQPLQTLAGPLSLIKIRIPDDTRKEIGDTDFNTNYTEFKNKYLNEPKFELVKRDDFEMLRLSESNNNVMACFSNLPKSKILGIKL